MSAADSLAKFGTGARNLAIAAAIVAAIGVAWWLVKKSKQIGAATEEVAGFLFGADTASETLGTWLYDATHPESPAPLDEAQAINTCNAIWRSKGDLTGPICTRLRDAGKLTAP